MRKNFYFAAWEISGDHQTFSNRFHVEASMLARDSVFSGRVELRNVKRHCVAFDAIHFRVAGAPCQGGWVLAQPAPAPIAVSCSLRRIHRDVKGLNLRVAWLDAMREGSWGRLYFGNDDLLGSLGDPEGKKVLILCANGWGHWLRAWNLERVNHLGNEGAFQWSETPQPHLLAQTPALELLETLRPKWSDTSTSIGFARNWIEKSVDERNALLRVNNRDPLEEFTRVLKWILFVDGGVWQSCERLRWKVNFPVLDGRTLDEKAIEAFDDFELARSLAHFAREHFASWHDKSPPCVAQWNRWRLRRLQLDLMRPTAHEQVEASLELEAWIRENLPPNQRQLFVDEAD